MAWSPAIQDGGASVLKNFTWPFVPPGNKAAKLGIYRLLLYEVSPLFFSDYRRRSVL